MDGLQVKVRVGDEEKGTAAAEGLEEPGWAEVLEFAVSGELASKEDEEVVVRVWDHHWVRQSINQSNKQSINQPVSFQLRYACNIGPCPWPCPCPYWACSNRRCLACGDSCR